MGGFGSGRGYRSGRNVRVEDCFCLDINLLKRSGYIEEDSVYIFTGDGAMIRHHRIVENTGILLRFDSMDFQNPYIEVGYGLFERHTQKISLSRTATQFGGSRFWMHCPLYNHKGHKCDRRVAKLYIHPSNNITGCRQCLKLMYSSQIESKVWNHFNQAWKYSAMLSGGSSIDYAPKPKHMRWKTYDRLHRKMTDHARIGWALAPWPFK